MEAKPAKRWPFAIIVLLCLSMAALQIWRAQMKHGLHQARLQALAQAPIELTAHHRQLADLPSPRVILRGVWDPEATLLLDNRTYAGRTGYHVLTPLRLAAGGEVLVNRGWIAAPRLRSERPTPPAPGAAGVEVVFEGWAVDFETRGFRLGDGRPDGLVWPDLRYAVYREVTGRDPLPLLVLRMGDEPGAADTRELVRPWTQPEDRDPAWKHIGYATMWGILALIAGLYWRVGRAQRANADQEASP